MSSESLSIEKSPRIASYKIPADTWVLSVLLIGLATLVRFFGNDQVHTAVDAVLFLVFVVKGLDFVFSFLRPNSVLGGAEIRTAALAGAALLAWLA